MMKSLFSGVSGLKNHTVRMDVIGNNIANVNTTAFKANTVTFRDIFYQTRNFASAGSAVSGGTNPRQVGYGVALGSIENVMTQSGLTFTGNELDCAIVGAGFFQVMDPAGNIYYTRNGTFNIDNAGNLVDSNGYIVLGVSGDPTGIGPSVQRINLFVPDVQNERASGTRTALVGNDEYEVTFSVSAYGPAGNISINVIHSESPFATMNGNVVTVSMDLTQDFASPDDFQDALNAAITAGGINPGVGILPINVEFSGTPAAGTAALQAGNTFIFVDRSVSPSQEHELSFQANLPGVHANSYNISMTTSTSITEVRAQWSQNVLTITLPARLDAAGDYVVPAITEQMIQDAINRAAGMREDSASPTGWDESTGTEARKLTVTGDLSTFSSDIRALLGTSPRAIGLHGGEDNFYRTIIERGVVVLENGRFAGPQSVRDLDLIFINSSGEIIGEHPVHGTLRMGRIDLAIFQNEAGLLQHGTSYFRASLASGPAEVKVPESDGAGAISSGSIEMANVDLSEEFSNMIITQRGFQANSRIITVSDTMLEELINLKR
jgi:flagellar hook protein FlgE